MRVREREREREIEIEGAMGLVFAGQVIKALLVIN